MVSINAQTRAGEGAQRTLLDEAALRVPGWSAWGHVELSELQHAYLCKPGCVTRRAGARAARAGGEGEGEEGGRRQ